jgi:DNA-binding IclR family transcriptional regulator
VAVKVWGIPREQATSITLTEKAKIKTDIAVIIVRGFFDNSEILLEILFCCSAPVVSQVNFFLFFHHLYKK